MIASRLSALPPDVAKSQQQARELARASEQFESMLLKRVLGALEKTARISSAGSAPAGASAYGSMVVEALSDAIAQAGGLGLGQDMVRQLTADLPKNSNHSQLLKRNADVPLKASASLPFPPVRATPTESNPVLVNRRNQ